MPVRQRYGMIRLLAKEKHNKRTTERRACSGNICEDEEKPLLLGLYKQSFENPSNFIKSFCKCDRYKYRLFRKEIVVTGSFTKFKKRNPIVSFGHFVDHPR